MVNNTRAFSLIGDATKENPRQWLKEVQSEFATTATDADKLALCRQRMEAHGPAEDWYDDLQPADIATFTTFTAAFNLKWPKLPRIQDSRATLMSRVQECRLDEADIGKETKYEGRRVYGQVKWALTIKKHADAVPDPTGIMIPQAVDNLPKLIRKKLLRSFNTWQELVDTVTDISQQEIRYAQEKEDGRKRSEMPNASTLTPIADRLAKTTLFSPSTPRVNWNTAPQIPQTPQTPFTPTRQQTQYPRQQSQDFFVNPAPMAQSNLFYQTRPANYAMPQTPTKQFPFLQERADNLRQTLPSMHPPTDAGRRTYEQQRHEWHDRNGDRRADDTCPYPLTPGTAPIGSKECYKCGKAPAQGMRPHTARECTETPVPPHEANWRALAANILGTRGPLQRPQMIVNPPITPIRQVDAYNQGHMPTTYTYQQPQYGTDSWIYQVPAEYYDNNSGNGLESHQT
jgi:hypothetical protein